MKKIAIFRREERVARNENRARYARAIFRREERVVRNENRA